MLARRIIPCLDVRDGKVVKGVQFRNHEEVGDIDDLALRYCEEGADEIVFYDIAASAQGRSLDRSWIENLTRVLDIPFCVAGGIRTLQDAREILNRGAEKVSINSPALENPSLIEELSNEFGRQCIVIGVDSLANEQGEYEVYQYTGLEEATRGTSLKTMDWIKKVQELGAGEIVLNCMSQDGMKNGYDLPQLKAARTKCKVPLIASGGAGSMQHFQQVFDECDVDGALAASVFHKSIFSIPDLKQYLLERGTTVRIRK